MELLFPADIAAPLLPHSGEGSKHTSTTRHTLHSLHQYTPLSFVVHYYPCYVPGYEYQIMFLFFVRIQIFGNRSSGRAVVCIKLLLMLGFGLNP